MKPENEQWIKDVAQVLDDLIFDSERVTQDSSLSWFKSYSRDAKLGLINMPYGLVMILPENLRMDILKLQGK